MRSLIESQKQSELSVAHSNNGLGHSNHGLAGGLGTFQRDGYVSIDDVKRQDISSSQFNSDLTPAENATNDSYMNLEMQTKQSVEQSEIARGLGVTLHSVTEEKPSDILLTESKDRHSEEDAKKRREEHRLYSFGGKNSSSNPSHPSSMLSPRESQEKSSSSS